MADKPDEPMDLTDLPLPSRSNAPVKTQDAAASTSATPFAEPPSIAAPKSSAQRQREYRQRIAASRTPAQSTAMRISDTERKRNYRLRKAANLALASGSLESTTASSSRSAERSNDAQNSIQRQLTNQQLQSLAAEPAQTTVQIGTSSDQIEVPDEPMDLTDLPVPSTIAAPKSSAQRQREYRQRIAASRTPAQSTATRISNTERKRNYRLRKAANLALASGSLESTTASSSRSAGKSNVVQNSTQRQLTNQQRQSLAAEPAQTTVQPEAQKMEAAEDSTSYIKHEPECTLFLQDDMHFKAETDDTTYTNTDSYVPGDSNTSVMENSAMTTAIDPTNIVSNTETLITTDVTENLFQNVQIKEELTLDIEQEDSRSSTDVTDMKCEEESILPTTENIKEEKDDKLISYDYPTFEDSMDTSEATALSQVEACLKDNINIKSENDAQFDEHQKDYPKIIKVEPDLTVTETHLISNKLINTTSTITSTHNGIIESQTTKTLVMEIHPMTQRNTFKLGNPEEILPNEDAYEMDCDEPFQLNSITGNILSLEQEAYGLLSAKKNTNETFVFCPKCPKVYKHKCRLKRHLKLHATIEKNELSRIRGIKKRLETTKKKRQEQVKTEIELAQDDHMKVEEKDGYKCTCNRVFQRRSRMETCLRSHSSFEDSSFHACSTCDRKFTTKDDLMYHRNRQHRKKFPCKFCPTDYNTQKELLKHLQAHQKVQLTEYKVISEVAKGKQELQCLLCPKNYSKLPEFKSHIMEDHQDPYKCPTCEENFTRITDFACHIKKAHPDVGSESVLDVLQAFSKLVKAWKCEECGKQFHKADKLALHNVQEHIPEMKSEQHFQCEDCQRVFISNQGLNSHRRMHHKTESTEEEKPQEVGVLCLECRKICADMNALTSHMRLHSMDRKFPCKYCDFRFATQQKRKAHAEIHTGDMKYVCFICEYQCSSENRLKHHKASIKHINMKEYLLSGKPFIAEEQSTSKQDSITDTPKTKEWGVKKKKRKHKDSTSEEVECDICGEKFPGESEMQEHKQTHPFIEFPNEDTPSRIFFK